MQVLSFEEKYNAIFTKDTSFDGIFVTAVKTTGIFCRPACPARKPKPENVIFFDTTEEAILHGFRPCLICKPMEQPGKTPDHIATLLEEITSNPDLRIRDADLRKRKIDPTQVRRWFKKNHQMSFQAYQRMLRINTALTELSKGKKVTDSAFDSGYQSLSGFNERFRRVIGANPAAARTKNIINIRRLSTPLGPMFACATTQGLCLLEFTNRRMLETEFTDLQRRLNAKILPGDNVHLNQVEKELEEYFKGLLKTFTVALHLPGTEFQQRVWQELISVPYGETISYKRLASRLSSPAAIRAVASANGHNRVSIIVPCHRVIGEDGHLTGYGGGLPRKRWLVDFEFQHK